MNPSGSLVRKIAYLAAFVVLAIPVVWLGAPSTTEDQGGKLAQLRSEARLGQADLGAIDPASETIRLATLGLRGVAVTMLWSKANEYKKTEDWTTFQSTLEQLARLQPYFIKVWEYQAWNLSYNVSVELDNVRDRFYYVKQGIKYLTDGIGYNRENATLLDDLGWFTGNKVGRADEHEIYRKLYRVDDDLNPDDVPELRDNWLASKRWYEQAVRAIDVGGQPLGTKNPVTFFDSPARSQISYAEAIEEEGTFTQLTKRAWQLGAQLWKEYGEREMRSTEDYMVRLVDEKRWQDEAKELRGELDKLDPGLQKRMEDEARAALTAKQRELLESFPPNPTAEETKLHDQAQAAVEITLQELAARIAKDHPDKAPAAQKLAKEIHEAERRAALINSDRDVANYEYWRIRCDLEQTQQALEGHQKAHDAARAFKEADRERAKELYEQSFESWSKALAMFPELPADSTTGDDLLDVVKEYAKVLEQLDLRLSHKDVIDRFALWDIVEANDHQQNFAEDLKVWQDRKSGRPQMQPLVNPAETVPQ